MPKMKSKSGALKRFKVKKNGSIKRGSAFRSHILTKKSQKRKRNLRSPQTVSSSDTGRVNAMLCKA
ncbi:50S ribosomal protein L35 [Malaciobacter pacificus]|jgi:large subunit ribosomal protein L35|uniref:Large ribosomal subunit protein bL35 n=1 Tax=Malaciobacter pacificus TaxID=1080223 RepID=A0A5C2H397_9BACT|nr:50S ribosomal protein L35 [Malaciobacter pacificus]QEP33371.1 50S ribosomal protein L35 [Malaciobacter pacificus]GGD30868.1 50S ribosomal protein L35 [Malaciobacter pacificus]